MMMYSQELLSFARVALDFYQHPLGMPSRERPIELVVVFKRGLGEFMTYHRTEQGAHEALELMILHLGRDVVDVDASGPQRKSSAGKGRHHEKALAEQDESASQAQTLTQTRAPIQYGVAVDEIDEAEAEEARAGM